MKMQGIGFLGALLLLSVGAALVVTGWVFIEQRRLLDEADALAANGNYAAALHTYEAAAAQYTTTIPGLPAEPVLHLFSRFGLVPRNYINLRVAEMALREGERLFDSYKREQRVVSPLPSASKPNGNATDRPSLHAVLTHFTTAATQYQHIRTAEPYWQFIANANYAHAMVQIFLIRAFLSEPPQAPAGVKQDLVRAITSLQKALNALYTDQVRVAVADERRLVLLLEALTRFRRPPEVEAEERRKLDQFFKETQEDVQVAPLGEILRSAEQRPLSSEEQSMRDFLLNQSAGAAVQEQTDRLSREERSGRGSADAGSRGSLH